VKKMVCYFLETIIVIDFVTAVRLFHFVERGGGGGFRN
jgi:hypothetical protein